jgi:hypothetical protein
MQETDRKKKDLETLGVLSISIKQDRERKLIHAQEERQGSRETKQKKAKINAKIKTSNDSKCIQALTGIIEAPIEGPGRYFVVSIRWDQALVHMNAGIPIWKGLSSERHVSAVGRHDENKTKKQKAKRRGKGTRN